MEIRVNFGPLYLSLRRLGTATKKESFLLRLNIIAGRLKLSEPAVVARGDASIWKSTARRENRNMMWETKHRANGTDNRVVAIDKHLTVG